MMFPIQRPPELDAIEAGIRRYLDQNPLVDILIKCGIKIAARQDIDKRVDAEINLMNLLYSLIGAKPWLHGIASTDYIWTLACCEVFGI